MDKIRWELPIFIALIVLIGLLVYQGDSGLTLTENQAFEVAAYGHPISFEQQTEPKETSSNLDSIRTVREENIQNSAVENDFWEGLALVIFIIGVITLGMMIIKV